MVLNENNFELLNIQGNQNKFIIKYNKLENNNLIIGGLCFSLSKEDKIASIHLLAISNEFQFKGNETELLNEKNMP